MNSEFLSLSLSPLVFYNQTSVSVPALFPRGQRKREGERFSAFVRGSGRRKEFMMELPGVQGKQEVRKHLGKYF